MRVETIVGNMGGLADVLRAGRPGGINSPEDLASAFGGIMLGMYGDLGNMDPASICQLLKGNYTAEFNEARTAFNEEYRKVFDQVDPANLLGTMGAAKGHCGDCGAGSYGGAHSDFSTLDEQKTGSGIPWRNVYKDMPITWPGDPKKDPCCKE